MRKNNRWLKKVQQTIFCEVIFGLFQRLLRKKMLFDLFQIVRSIYTGTDIYENDYESLHKSLDNFLF